MTTLVSAEMNEYAHADDALPDYPSSVFAGITGNQAHRTSNTYHFSLEDQAHPAVGNYTNKFLDDKMPTAGSTKYATASDKSMSTADMIREWNRYLAVFNDRSDPRRQYIAEYIGWNGVGDAERLDFQANTRASNTSDHKWHSHKARRRRYYNSKEATRAFLSIDRGETKEQYLGVTAASGGNEEVTKVIQFNQPDGNRSWHLTNGLRRRGIPTWPAVQWWAAVSGQATDAHTVSTEAELTVFGGVLDEESDTKVVMDSMVAEAIGAQVANAVVAHTGNGLTEADLDAIQQQVVEGIKQVVLGEGVKE